MGFETKKPGAENKSAETTARQEQQQQRRTERTHEADSGASQSRRPKMGRNQRYRRGADEGRAAKMLEAYKTINEGHEDDNSRLIMLSGKVKGLAPDRGFLIHTSLIGPDVYYHLFVVENSDSPVVVKKADRGRRFRSQEVDINRYVPTVDGIDNAMLDLIEGWMQTNVLCDGEYVFTNVTVIPTEVDLEDVVAVKTYLMAAEDANFTISGTDAPFTAEELTEGSRIQGTIGFNANNEHTDMLGLPYRADFTADVQEVVKDTSGNPLLVSEGGETFVTVDGKVQPRYIGPSEDPRRARDLSKYDPACFVPEVEVTLLDTYTMEGGCFERSILGLGMLPNLTVGDAHLTPFMRTFGDDPNRKLSGLAYGMPWPNDEMPAGLERVDEDENARYKWIQSVFHLDDGCEYSVRIKEGGLGYTFGKLLIDMANGDVNAYYAFIDASDNVTGGEFGKRWDGNGPRDIVADWVRLPSGIFRDSKGTHSSDLIDSITILNKLKGSEELIDDWYECTSPGERRFDADECMSRLVRVYEHVTGNQFVMKSMDTKVYLNPHFLEVLYDALQASDLAVEVDFEGGQEYRTSRRFQGTGTSLAMRNVARQDRRSFRTQRGRGFVHTRWGGGNRR